MARHFGKFATQVWDDPDWWELSLGAQHAYMLLISQDTITPVGIVPMTMNKWANSTREYCIERLSEALQELSDKAYIVIDWRRETLLVRSFVRWDKGYENSLRLKAIQSAALTVRSPMLAGVLAYELDRLNVRHGIAASPVDAQSKPLRGDIEGALPVDSEERKPPDQRGFDAASKDSFSSLVVSTEVGDGRREPQTGEGRGEKQRQEGASAPAADAAPRPKGTRIPDQFFITDAMRKWAEEEVPGLDLSWYTRKFVDYWRSATRNATKLDWTRTWQNWMRDEFEKPNHRRINGRQVGTADQRVMDHLGMAQRMAEREAASTQGLKEIEA